MTMYANKTTTLAIVAIVTAIALVAAGSITTSAVAARKHAIKSDSLATTRGTDGLSGPVIKELIKCLTSLRGADNQGTPLTGVGNQGTPLRGPITDCVNSALGLGFGTSPNREALTSSSNGNSDSVPSTAMMTGQ
jgi:hypothetical protein